MADLHYSKILIRAQFFQPLPLATKYFVALNLGLKIVWVNNTVCMVLLFPQQHKGHRFVAQQFKVRTVCEYCSDPIPLLEKGEVCEGG